MGKALSGVIIGHFSSFTALALLGHQYGDPVCGFLRKPPGEELCVLAGLMQGDLLGNIRFFGIETLYELRHGSGICAEILENIFVLIHELSTPETEHHCAAGFSALGYAYDVLFLHL